LNLPLALSIVLTAIVVLLCTLLHYEAISRLDTFARTRRWPNHAILVCVLIALLLIHAAEIGLFAGVYVIADSIGIGGLRSEKPSNAYGVLYLRRGDLFVVGFDRCHARGRKSA
jgi:uncharacterized membrane protein